MCAKTIAVASRFPRQCLQPARKPTHQPKGSTRAAIRCWIRHVEATTGASTERVKRDAKKGNEGHGYLRVELEKQNILAHAHYFEPEERAEFFELRCEVADPDRTVVRRAVAVPAVDKLARAATEAVAAEIDAKPRPAARWPTAPRRSCNGPRPDPEPASGRLHTPPPPHSTAPVLPATAHGCSGYWPNSARGAATPHSGLLPPRGVLTLPTRWQDCSEHGRWSGLCARCLPSVLRVAPA